MVRELPGNYNEFTGMVRAISTAIWRKLPVGIIRRQELESAGLSALVKAIPACAEQPDNRRRAYIAASVRNAIMDMLRSTSPIARRRQQHIRKFSATIRQLEGQYRRPADTAMLAEASDLTGIAVAQGTAVVFEDERSLRHVPSPDPDPFEVVADAELAAIIRSAVESLPHNHRVVIQRCVLGEDHQSEVAAALRVTQGYVSQIKAQAFAMLRDKLKEAA